MKYPADIPDYFKQAFPEGLTYDRKLTFEDGGCATATVEMRWVITYYLTVNQLFQLADWTKIFELSKTTTLHKDLGSMWKSENSRRISMMNTIMEASKVQ